MFRVHHNYMPDKEVEHTDIDVHIGDVITNLEYLGMSRKLLYLREVYVLGKVCQL